MQKTSYNFLRAHRGLVITVCVIAFVWVSACGVNLIVSQYPEDQGFSLSGRRMISYDMDMYIRGGNGIYFTTYGENNVAKKSKLPIHGSQTVGIVNTGDIAIPADGDAVYESFVGDSTYAILKTANGTTTDLGVYDKATLEQRIQEYKSLDTNIAVDTIRVEHDNYVFLGTEDMCGEGSTVGFNPFLPKYLCFSYNDNGVYVDTGTSSRKVYTFSEVTFPIWSRYVEVEGYSYDKKLAIIRFAYYNRKYSGVDVFSRIYAYDIKNNAWALLTDNPNERVIALR